MSAAPDAVTSSLNARITSESPADIVTDLRAHFASGATLPLGARQAALSNLERLVVERESDLLSALAEDLGKSSAEGWLTELALVRQSIRDLKRRLPAFIAAKKIRVPFVQRPGTAFVQREPLGCSLVIAPWNYPVQLLLIPVATAIAAGNVVVAKPSELAPVTSRVLASILAEFDPRILRVVEGDASTTQELIGCGVDHIFFTGSSGTGRAVMAAAAHHLTPVTLELGGKSPAFVDADADLEVAARRIVFAKFLNAGQTCVAPDYVLAHSAILDELISRIRTTLLRFYGKDPETSRDFGRIVNEEHFERLSALLEASRDFVAIGGQTDAGSRYIAPTVVVRPSPTSALMDDEIFGPILPIVEVADLESAIDAINAHPSPLAIYCFTNSDATLDRIALRTRSGSVTKNTAAEQFAMTSLPFGGVGESGIGAYHAGAGLEQFSYERSYLRRGTKLETALAYPPSSAVKLAILRRALRA